MDKIGVDEFKLLIDINSKINSSLQDLDELLPYILQCAMQLVQCESSSLILKNDDGSLRFAVALGPKGAEVKNIPIKPESIAGWVMQHKEGLILNDVANDKRFFSGVQNESGYTSRNMIAVPFLVNGESIGSIELLNKNANEDFNSHDLDVLNIFANQASIAYMNAKTYQVAQNKISVLQNKILGQQQYHTMIAKSPVMLDLLKMIDEIAKTNLSVVITGESGVGKELIAEQIHLRSNRKNCRFVRVNCAALAPTLLESELFGHVKGAFTDAKTERTGFFEEADGGTIFLDEIGEVPLELQAKLLRVIQDKQFQKVGSSKTISVDVRIIAATNRDLESMMNEKKFRDDLYFRLSGIPIKVPPLRERKEDIPALANFFLKNFSEETKKAFTDFSPSALEALRSYWWPGNIRELENAIERAVVLGKPPVVNALDLRIGNAVELQTDSVAEGIAKEVSLSGESRSLKDAVNNFKKIYVTKILQETNWNKTKAGKILDIQRTYVSRLISELSIEE